MNLLDRIKQKDACAFTHGGKFHADDVFSSALLLYINPEISITRGNKVPEDFSGIVFDIGRGEFDHHQKDSRIRENGVPYAAFGLLWEALGADILGEELADKFDEAFVQPLDNNDNTGEKNELATLIGNFNPAWDAKGGSDEAFFQAVSVAGMILENKFERYRGNERADKRVEEVLEKQEPGSRILVLPEFIPCQKALTETDIAFVIFPSNRGGYCIQPQKREYSMNYKCSFPSEWLGLEGDELVKKTGLSSAIFCHKGGFIMTVGSQEDAIAACKLALDSFEESAVIVRYSTVLPLNTDLQSDKYENETDELLRQTAAQLGIKGVKICEVSAMSRPQLEITEINEEFSYGELAMEKQEYKALIKDKVKRILKYKPEAVFVEGDIFSAYPVVHALRKKHIPVLTLTDFNGKPIIARIPSGS